MLSSVPEGAEHSAAFSKGLELPSNPEASLAITALVRLAMNGGFFIGARPMLALQDRRQPARWPRQIVAGSLR